MEGSGATLTPYEFRAILDLCKNIQENPDDTITVASNAQTLANQIQAITAGNDRQLENEEAATGAHRAMLQGAKYAEKKITEAATLVDKAASAVTQAKKAIDKAKSEMSQYYMIKDNSPELANTKVRKAIIQAGLAILELDYYELEN